MDAFRAVPGVKLLDYSTDQEFNRCVVTVVGQPAPLQAAMVDAIGRAVELIDMAGHVGQHPRVGAVDVVPFIPVCGCSIADADQLAKAVAREAAQKFDLPCYLYEKSASAAYRVDIADVRRGQFEGLIPKMQDPLWHPDFGPCQPHPTAGAAIISAQALIDSAEYYLQLSPLSPDQILRISSVRKGRGQQWAVAHLGRERIMTEFRPARMKGFY